MKLIDKDALYQRLKDAGMVFALHIVETAPVIVPPPNDPLTLEELREMDGEEGAPVYTTWNGWQICYGLVSKGDKIYMDIGMGCLIPMTDYSKTWWAYRRKPEDKVET